MKIKIARRMCSMLIAAVIVVSGLCVPSAFAASSQPGTTKTYTVTDAKFVRDEYSNWIRMNNIFKARRAGECGNFEETRTVKTTSSLSISVPINQVSAKLGYTVERTKSSTVIGTVSAPLKKNECCAFYYRDHWKVYKVTYKVNERTVSGNNGKGMNVQTKTYYETKTIKVAQGISQNDYGWFYASKASALKKNLNSKYCDDNYSCKVA